MTLPNPVLSLRHVHHPADASGPEITAARELAGLSGANLSPVAEPGPGVTLSLASRQWARPTGLGKAEAWMWLRLDDQGHGEIVASHGPFLFAAVRLLAGGLPDATREKLGAGVLLPATFRWHRPHFDSCLTQYWRSVRDFDPEPYVAALAEFGFTHMEVNGLQAHMPYEDLVAFEYYPQFYTYCAGFNHFVATELTRGFWPNHYLDANMANLVKLADLGQRYGLKPGLLMFEPRSLPERFFAKYPTLRGARVDHPFRSRLPRYTLTQDHPVVVRHYRECIQGLMRQVPELSYVSFFTNDSGAGFEHSASLYVGRNGGPYMIREWRNHEKIAETAGASIVRYLHNFRSAAAEINPDFDVLMRIEPFKVEHEAIKKGLGPHVTMEAPSLLVKGYSLPYQHPRYPKNFGVAGSLMHDWLDEAEKTAFAELQGRGIDPALNYSGSGIMNHEPLLGLPYPRLLHRKLSAMREVGFNRASCMGGLTHVQKLPYWPNPVIMRAVQFFPDQPVEEVLSEFATRLVGTAHAPALTQAWADIEEALSWQPLVALYGAFGFCWQRTWDRPFVPDIEAIPAVERRYYEDRGCFQHNNPGLVDLGKDVLFDLVNREEGTRMAADMDQQVLPRVASLHQRLNQLLEGLATDDATRPVFVDLRDRVRAFQHWVTAVRNVCSWCECVYTYQQESDKSVREAAMTKLQATIDLDLANTRGLIEFIETTTTEFMAVSGVGETTFMYGENLVDHLRTRVRLTEAYRHHPPRVDPDIMWRPVPGTTWPEGWDKPVT
jgi:hypothetical protein